MKKIYLSFIAIILLAVCLCACGRKLIGEPDDTSVSVWDIDLENVKDLRCEIKFKQSDETIVFEKEKAKGLASVVKSSSLIDSEPAYHYYLEDYIHICFTGAKSDKAYGCYTIYADDAIDTSASHNAERLIVNQFGEGTYDQIYQYILENK